ncbi:hypothetical protein [Microbulbifer halophilus]|uniref:hypothetical protein n=1 Tax=Microbulbifer halophilus TaxID=453963 RepID=UPI00362350BF
MVARNGDHQWGRGRGPLTPAQNKKRQAMKHCCYATIPTTLCLRKSAAGFQRKAADFHGHQRRLCHGE